jgi:ribonuclease III
MSELDARQDRLAWLQECERRIGFEFANKELFFEALTHASSSGSRLESNERLEFLGDAVLGFTVCEFLFERFTDWLEGDLTQIKSIVVSRQTCARLGRELHLDQCLVMGKGVTRENEIPNSVLANAFESTIAAIYLDAGFKVAKEFIMRHLEKEVHAAIAGNLERNHKSEFQQYSQKQFGQSPRYELISEAGPDHSKTFEVCAIVGVRRFVAAFGSNKKIAEQRAAANAMAEVMNQELPYPIAQRLGEDCN